MRNSGSKHHSLCTEMLKALLKVRSHLLTPNSLINLLSLFKRPVLFPEEGTLHLHTQERKCSKNNSARVGGCGSHRALCLAGTKEVGQAWGLAGTSWGETQMPTLSKCPISHSREHRLCTVAWGAKLSFSKPGFAWDAASLML